jgi:hypothetical protein
MNYIGKIMIYQKLKPFNSNNQDIDAQLVKNLIDEALQINLNCMNQLVEDLVFLAIDYKTDSEIVAAFAEGFNHLFSKGLKWIELEDIELKSRKENDKTIKFGNANILAFKNLIKPAFENYFIDEFIKSPTELKEMGFTMFQSNVCSDEKLLRIGEILDIPNNKDYLNELMLATRTFPQMKQASNIFNIDSWTVLTKETGTETLWPVYVWHMENVYLIAKQKTPFSNRADFFKENKSIFQNIKTDKTSNLDFQSRFVFASCNVSNDHNYAELLRDLGIKNLNLNCIDYTVDSEKQTLKERLLKFGKIKLINKFEKKQKIEIELDKVITASPNRGYMISNKKAFLKQYLQNLSDNINYTNLLESVLETKGRKYSNSLFEIKCYIPLKKQYLDKPKEYWNGVKVGSLFFIDINDYDNTSDTSNKSFINLLEWISDKDINWSKKTETGNYLITDTIILTMQLSNERLITDLSNPNNLLLTVYKSLSHFDKLEVLHQIKNEWKQIWDFANSTRHQQDILNTPYKKSSNTFKFMMSFMEDCLAENLIIDASFFDEKWEKIKQDILPYVEHDESAKKFSVLSNTVELNSTLTVSEVKKSQKPIKL